MQKPFDECFYRPSDDACWLWKEAQNGKGYGLYHSKSRGKAVLAHRYMWTLARGPIPHHDSFHGMCVCHRCDVPLCVNPSHLFLGTHQENMDDMMRKGRKGRKVGNLTWSSEELNTVLRVLASGATKEEVARAHGMRPEYVEKLLYEGRRDGAIDLTLKDLARKGFKRAQMGALGEANGRARMTEALVRELRAKHLRGSRSHDLAREYGLPNETVRAAIQGITWKHVK